MMSRIVWAAAALLSIAGPAAAQRSSPPTVLQEAFFQGSTYRLLSESSWPDAEAAALAMNGHLVTIEGAAENGFLVDAFSATVSALASTGTVAMWIGLNDAASEGTYRWSSGSTAAFRNWNPGQPGNSHADEDYVGIIVSGFGTPGLWHDAVLDLRFGDRTFGIVEISPVPEPGPAALWVAGLVSLGAFALRARGCRRAGPPPW